MDQDSNWDVCLCRSGVFIASPLCFLVSEATAISDPTPPFPVSLFQRYGIGSDEKEKDTTKHKVSKGQRSGRRSDRRSRRKDHDDSASESDSDRSRSRSPRRRGYKNRHSKRNKGKRSNRRHKRRDNASELDSQTVCVCASIAIISPSESESFFPKFPNVPHFVHRIVVLRLAP